MQRVFARYLQKEGLGGKMVSLVKKACRLNELPPVLEGLCEDPCHVVRVAARNLRSGLADGADKGTTGVGADGSGGGSDDESQDDGAGEGQLEDSSDEGEYQDW